MSADPMHFNKKRADRYATQALEFERDLRGYLYRLTRNPSDVEESLQEIYLRLLTEAEPGRPELLSVRGFAFKVAHDVAVNLIRRRGAVAMQKLPKLETPSQSDEKDGPDEIVANGEDRLRLRRAINDLPPRCREVLKMHLTDDCQRSEIADRLGIKVNTVKDHLKRAVQLLTLVMLYGPDSEPVDSQPDTSPEEEGKE